MLAGTTLPRPSVFRVSPMKLDVPAAYGAAETSK